jgi:hypothetical protein
MRQRLIWAPLALMLVVSAAAWADSTDADRVVMSAGSVLKVRLDDAIGSDRSQRGDRFLATVETADTGYNLPSGTRIEGVVTDVRKARKDQPGMVDVDFRTLQLPDGQRYRITGAPIGLDEKSVRRTDDGRLVARSSSSKNKTKFIAYGAGAGFLISTLTGGGSLKGALLGAAAGYLYGQFSKSKANGREVLLKPGTEFGVRLDQRVALAPTWNGYRTQPARG